ncbi:hypothetical protein EBV26_15405, partial [bacterium]|nr:hypothetical protein [bacterium]
ATRATMSRDALQKQISTYKDLKNKKIASDAQAVKDKISADYQSKKSAEYISQKDLDTSKPKQTTTQTQKDNEPVIERKYTKEQLAREIPIGKEMVDTYLDGKMPKGLQPRDRNHYSRPVFQNVLIGPADLGLLPPRSTSDEDDANKHLLRNGHHKTSKLRMKRRERERQRRRLYDNNTDLAETDGDLDLIVNDNKKHLFDLP